MKYEYIEGSGGGGSDKPKEVADNLKSTPYARLLVATSEGEIGGLVDGEASVYFNDVALTGPAGPAFQGVTIEQRLGTLDQPLIKGFNDVESIPAQFQQTEITQDVTPVRSLTKRKDAVRIILTIPALSHTQADGDIKPMYIQFRIEKKATTDTVWELDRHINFKGKSSSPVQIPYKVARPQSSIDRDEGWDYRIVRISPDYTDNRTHNRLILSTHVEIEEQLKTYENTALLAVMANLEQFGSQIPRVSADLSGIVVQVPSNYSQDENGIPTYSGIWDGTWKEAVTDNPVWIWRHLIVLHERADGSSNARYSLGLPASSVDVGELYQCARYCDAVDGSGNFIGIEVTDPESGQTERIRRFTCNTVINSSRSAFEWLAVIAATMRASVYIANGVVHLAQDRPRNPVAQFTNANVVEGRFNRGSSAAMDRITAAYVTYNSPSDNFQQAVAVWEDEEAILRYGRNEVNISILTTSYSEALMVAKWAVESSLTERHTLSFQSGMDAADLKPGDVIEILDNNFHAPGSRGTRRYAGRIQGGDQSSIEIDQTASLGLEESFELVIVNEDGNNYEVRPVTNAPGSTKTLTVDPPFSTAVRRNHLWMLRSSEVPTQLWRVMRKTQSEKMAFDVQAMSHDPDKYDRIESGITTPAKQYQRVETRTIGTPDAPTVQQRTRLDSLGRAHIDLLLSCNPVEGAVQYRFLWSRDAEDSQQAINNLPEHVVRDAEVGEYQVRAQAVNGAGTESLVSAMTTYQLELAATTGLQPPLNLRTPLAGGQWTGQQLRLDWDANPANADVVEAVLSGYEVTIKDFSGNVLRTATVPASTHSYVYDWASNVADGGPRRNIRLEVRSKDVVTGLSDPIALDASNPPPGIPGDVSFDTDRLDGYRIRYTAPPDPDWVGIRVWHSTTSGFTPEPVNQAADATGEVVDVEAERGTTYFVRFGLYDAFGPYDLLLYPQTEIHTSTTQFAIPATPTGLAVTTTTARVGGVDQIRLIVTWDAVNGATGYDVGIAVDESDPTETVHQTSATRLELQVLPDTDYVVRVRAVNVNERSPWSASASHTTPVDTSITPSYAGYYEPLAMALTGTMAEVARIELDSGNQPAGGQFGFHLALDVPAAAGTYSVSAQILKDGTIIRGPFIVLSERQEAGGAAWTVETYISLPMDDPYVGLGTHAYTVEMATNSTASVSERQGWMSA